MVPAGKHSCRTIYIPEYIPARVPEDVLSCTVGVVSHEHAMGGQRARMAGARPRGGAATLLYAPEVVMIELPLAALLARQRARVRAALGRPRVATLGARQAGRGGITVLVGAPGVQAGGHTTTMWIPGGIPCFII